VKTTLGVVGAVAVASCSPATPSAAPPVPATPSLAIVDVSVIPMAGDRDVLDRYTVLVTGDRITAVGPAASVVVPEGTPRVDGTGRYLIPGLADMHVHLEHFTDPSILRVFLRHGVTTVRNMDGRPYLLDWRRRVAAGELPGPNIVTAGPLLDGSPPLRDDNLVVRDAAEARAAVLAQDSAGYDFVKVYTNLSREAYQAIVATAAERNLPVAGHVPRPMSVQAVMAAGQRAIEHLDGYDDLIESDSSPYRGRWHWSKLYLGMPADSAKITRAAVMTAEARTWNVPTLVVKTKLAPLHVMKGWLHELDLSHLPPAVRAHWDPASWDEGYRRRLESFGSEELEVLEAGRANRSRLVRALGAVGAGLLVGTDTPNPFVLPGAAVHEELRLFVEAGLTPHGALAAATREPARFLGRLQESGTIEPGKRADLVLLTANPLEDIRNTERIAAVVVRGTYMAR
jgi:imidazolonepropionase-like amidohydrolase